MALSNLFGRRRRGFSAVGEVHYHMADATEITGVEGDLSLGAYGGGGGGPVSEPDEGEHGERKEDATKGGAGN
jgi:hypothetical protein